VGYENGRADGRKPNFQATAGHAENLARAVLIHHRPGRAGTDWCLHALGGSDRPFRMRSTVRRLAPDWYGPDVAGGRVSRHGGRASSPWAGEWWQRWSPREEREVRRVSARAGRPARGQLPHAVRVEQAPRSRGPARRGGGCTVVPGEYRLDRGVKPNSRGHWQHGVQGGQPRDERAHSWPG